MSTPSHPTTGLKTAFLSFFFSGSIAAGFGVAVGTGALFIFGEVPRVRNDILRQLPFFDTYYDRTIPAEDNVSLSSPIEVLSHLADIIPQPF